MDVLVEVIESAKVEQRGRLEVSAEVVQRGHPKRNILYILPVRNIAVELPAMTRI